MHNLCVFCTFSTFAQKIFKGWGCNFTWSFSKVMHSKSMKMVFVARIIRHKLYMIYAFYDFFVQKLFSYCCDKFDYPVSIVYFSCFDSKFKPYKGLLSYMKSHKLSPDKNLFLVLLVVGYRIIQSPQKSL